MEKYYAMKRKMAYNTKVHDYKEYWKARAELCQVQAKLRLEN